MIAARGGPARLRANRREDDVSAPPQTLNVPYRIETARLVIRCYDPADAPLLKAAVDASVEHLRPWMPWAANEPQPLEQKIELLRSFRGKFDLGQEFPFGIFSPDEREQLGGTGFHPRVGPQALEIGYWVRVDAVNRGIATESTAALTRVGFELLKLQRLEIRCDPANAASAAVPRRLGYRHDATLRRCIISGVEGKLRDSMVWTMLAEEYASSPAAKVEYRAFDAARRPVVV